MKELQVGIIKLRGKRYKKKFSRVEGWYYPAPLSVRSVRKTFALHGSRFN